MRYVHAEPFNHKTMCPNVYVILCVLLTISKYSLLSCYVCRIWAANCNNKFPQLVSVSPTHTIESEHNAILPSITSAEQKPVQWRVWLYVRACVCAPLGTDEELYNSERRACPLSTRDKLNGVCSVPASAVASTITLNHIAFAHLLGYSTPSN